MPSWNNSTVLGGDPAETVVQLERDTDGEVLGTGKRLFGETSDKKTMRLARSQPLGDGVTRAVYEPVR